MLKERLYEQLKNSITNEEENICGSEIYFGNVLTSSNVLKGKRVRKGEAPELCKFRLDVFRYFT